MNNKSLHLLLCGQRNTSLLKIINSVYKEPQMVSLWENKAAILIWFSLRATHFIPMSVTINCPWADLENQKQLSFLFSISPPLFNLPHFYPPSHPSLQGPYSYNIVRFSWNSVLITFYILWLKVELHIKIRFILAVVFTFLLSLQHRTCCFCLDFALCIQPTVLTTGAVLNCFRSVKLSFLTGSIGEGFSNTRELHKKNKNTWRVFEIGKSVSRTSTSHKTTENLSHIA